MDTTESPANPYIQDYIDLGAISNVICRIISPIYDFDECYFTCDITDCIPGFTYQLSFDKEYAKTGEHMKRIARNIEAHLSPTFIKIIRLRNKERISLPRFHTTDTEVQVEFTKRRIRYTLSSPLVSDDISKIKMASCERILKLVHNKQSRPRVHLEFLVDRGEISDTHISEMIGSTDVSFLHHGQEYKFNFSGSAMFAIEQILHMAKADNYQYQPRDFTFELEPTSILPRFFFRTGDEEGIFVIKNFDPRRMIPMRRDDGMWSICGTGSTICDPVILIKDLSEHHQSPWVVGAYEFAKMQDKNQRYMIVSKSCHPSDPAVDLYHVLIKA